MTDRTLFPLPPADGNLTERQAIALELLAEHPHGLRSTDLGVGLHQALSVPCSCASTAISQTACKWAKADGDRVGRQLSPPTPSNRNGRGLAIKRKTGLWQLIRPVRPADTGTLPDNF